jgi:hypothetical protein
MYQQLWGYKVEEKLYLGVREQKRLNITALKIHFSMFCYSLNFMLLLLNRGYVVVSMEMGLLTDPLSIPQMIHERWNDSDRRKPKHS